jgi:hypothetical protein
MPMEPVWLQGCCMTNPRRCGRCGSTEVRDLGLAEANLDWLACTDCGNVWGIAVLLQTAVFTLPAHPKSAVAQPPAVPNPTGENRAGTRGVDTRRNSFAVVGLFAMFRGFKHWAECHLWRRQSISR